MSAAPPAKRARAEHTTDGAALIEAWREAKRKCDEAEEAYNDWYYETWWVAAEPIWKDIDQVRDAYTDLQSKRTDKTRAAATAKLDKIVKDLIARAEQIEGFDNERRQLIAYIEFQGRGAPWQDAYRYKVPYKSDQWYGRVKVQLV